MIIGSDCILCKKVNICKYNKKVIELNEKITEITKDIDLSNSGIFIRINCPGYYMGK